MPFGDGLLVGHDVALVIDELAALRWVTPVPLPVRPDHQVVLARHRLFAAALRPIPAGTPAQHQDQDQDQASTASTHPVKDASRPDVPLGSACHHGLMSADLLALLAQASDESKSSTERLFAAVTLRKQIDLLIEALDNGSQGGGITAAVVTDVLTKGEGQSGTYHVESGTFEPMSRDEAERRLDSMTKDK